jgi:cytochrome c biogenesis protein CcdA
MTPCTSAGCFLAQKGGLISLPLVTIAGIIDGINPCAISMLVLLLTYLIIFAKKEERVLKTGLLYTSTIYLTYLTIGLFFYKSVSSFNLLSIRNIINPVIGGLLLMAGIINIKDAFIPQFGPHLQIPQSSRGFLKRLAQRVSYPAVIVLGILVTILETPCSLPIYIGTATILSQSKLPIPIIMGYFIYYNLLFILPLIVILLIVWRAKNSRAWKIIEMEGFEHKYKKHMKFTLGALLIFMGWWLVR